MELNRSSDGDEMQVQIQCVLERHLFQEMRTAVNRILDLDLLFPPRNPDHFLISPQDSSLKKDFDKWQSCAANFMMKRGGAVDTTPLLLVYGTFGSGKTYTLATSTMEILEGDRDDPKILICTNSNSAADVYITNYFSEFVSRMANKKKTIHMCRVYDYSHEKRCVPNEIKKGGYWNLDETTMQFSIQPEKLDKCQLVITTTSTAARLPLNRFTFTHILIDEAAQVLEMEAIIPLALAKPGKTCVVLTGDHRQIGPAVYSEEARKRNFHQSLLQRLIEYTQAKAFHRVVFFTNNYRTHPQLLEFLSKVFYTERVPESKVKCPPATMDKHDVSPMEFRSVLGVDKATGTSYVNDWEVRKIKKLLSKKALQDVTAERVQDAQGKQYKVVIVSTVRTHHTLNNNLSESPSSGHYFGFLSDGRQLNTAFSRAQFMVIVIGHPIALCTIGQCRIVWRKYIANCFTHDTFFPKQELSSEEVIAQSHIMTSLQAPKAVSRTTKYTQGINLQDVEGWIAENQGNHAVDEKLLDHTLPGDNKSDKILEWFKRHLENEDQDDELTFSSPSGEGTEFIPLEGVERNLEEDYPDKCIFHVDYEGMTLYAVPIGHDGLQKKIFISTNTQRNTALNGDIVDVQIISRDEGEDFGEVIKIERRAENMVGKEVVCVLDQFSDNLMVPIDKSFPKIRILLRRVYQKDPNVDAVVVPIFQHGKKDTKPTLSRQVKVTNDERSRKVFLVQWFKWDAGQTYPLGMVVDDFPDANTMQNALNVLKLAYSVTDLAPDDRCVANLSRDVKREISNRPKAFHDVVFTIDPPESCDYDDAFSIEEEGGDFIIGIHVADMAFFVESSRLEKTARSRAVSYYPYGDDPIYILPAHLITNFCSLEAGRERLTISLYITLDARGKVKSQPRFRRQYICSQQNLKYSDAQNIIQENESDDIVKRKVVQLYKIASAHRQNRLGLPKFTDTGGCSVDLHPQARLIVDELSIIANHEVAKYLVSLEKYAPCTPFRRHPPPHRKDFHEWRKQHASVIKYSLFLQSEEKWLMTYETESADKWEKKETKPTETIPTLKSVWNEIDCKAVNGDKEDVSQLVCCDAMYPTIASALRNLQHIMEKEEFLCNGSDKLSGKSTSAELRHTELRQDVYTHFTSPFRDYIDIMVQRLLVSAMLSRDPPYTQAVVNAVCTDFDIKSAKAKKFHQKVLEVHLALKVKQSPDKLLSFVENVTEDDMTVGFSSYPSVLFAKQRNTIGFNYMKPIKQPMVELIQNTSTTSLTWKERIHNRHTVASSDHFGSDTSNEKEILVVISDAFHEEIPGAHWMRLLDNISSNDPDHDKIVTFRDVVVHTNKELEEGKTREWTRVVSRRNRLPASTSIATEVLCANEKYVNFKRSFATGGIVQVQLIPEFKRGVISPSIGLVNITPGFEICKRHRCYPVESFAKVVDDRPRRDDIEAYQQTWIPIIEMDTTLKTLLSNDTIIVHDLIIEWEIRNERLLSGSFVIDDPHRILKYVLGRKSRLKKCFLCIRYQMTREGSSSENSVGRSTLLSIERQEYTFVAHAFVVQATIPKEPENAPMIVVFEVTECLSPFPNELKSGSLKPPCTIEFIPKTIPDRTLEKAVSSLHETPATIQKICLNVEKPDEAIEPDEGDRDDIDEQLTDISSRLAQECDKPVKGSPFPDLNLRQKEVMKSALKQSFTVIQGPPGTGKTVTGAYMAYFFTEMNSQLVETKDRPQLLVCGPSHKSVDVIAGKVQLLRKSLKEAGEKQHLSFVRVYSDRQESKRYPINGFNHPVSKIEKIPQIDRKLEMDSLHSKIRQSSNSGSQLILEFEKKYGTGSSVRPLQKQYDEYKYIIQQAEQNEMRKHNVILCTCSTAGSFRISSQLNAIEVIVDEAGMCSEPETLIPLVFAKPKRVVLIGDHKQLRPIIIHQTAKKLGMEKSLLEQYSNQIRMLNIQYRMHKAICDFPSKEFYEDQLRTHRPPNKDKNYEHVLRLWSGGAGKDQPIVFCHIQGKEETVPVTTEEGHEKSKFNNLEIDQVTRIVKRLTELRVKHQDIAILSQYSQQTSRIARKLKQMGLAEVVASTVARSQGGEWDFVILSTVRTLPWWKIEERPTKGWRNAHLGCITDENEMNVALTRAREGLVIVGDRILLAADKTWNKLIRHYKNKDCLIDAKNFLSSK